MEDYDEPLCEFQEYYWEDDFYQLNQNEADDYRHEGVEDWDEYNELLEDDDEDGVDSELTELVDLLERNGFEIAAVIPGRGKREQEQE